MRHSLKLSALLAMLLASFALFGSIGAAAAQDDTDELLPSDLEGIQYGVSRSYTFDFSAMMMTASPEAEMSMPGGVLSLGALVLEFDNAEHADAAMSTLADEFFTSEMVGETAEEVDLELGESNTSYVDVEDIDGQASESVLSLIHDGNYVYLIFGVGAEVDMQAMVTDIAEQMIEAEGSGEGEFSADGTSTGGLWDKFPDSDSDMLAGLVVSDEMIYPEPDGSEQG